MQQNMIVDHLIDWQPFLRKIAKLENAENVNFIFIQIIVTSIKNKEKSVK